MERKKVVILVCCIVFVLAIPPMINFKIFVPWDLIFGSGMQALGSLFAVITAAWFIKRSAALKELSEGRKKAFPLFLYWWMRIFVPAAILFVGINWLLEEIFKIKIFG
jgi:SNF family Na+-dependent transporter